MSADSPSKAIAGQRRPKVSATQDIDPQETSVRCPNGHTLSRYLTPFDGYSCTQCSRSFPWYTVLYGCRDCDHDLCQRCMSQQAGLKPPDPSGANLDVLDAEEAMTRDQFKLANASPEERRELQAKKRAAQEKAREDREAALAQREAWKAKEAAERAEEVQWAKFEAKEKRKVESENARDTAAFNRREAQRKKDDKRAAAERKKLDATRALKEKEEERFNKNHDRAKAKVDNAVNRGRSIPVKELEFLYAQELEDIMNTGYLSSKDQAAVEKAHAIQEANESEAVLYKARMIDAEKRLREEQIERDQARKEEAIELKTIVDARRAELAAEREERKKEMDEIRKGYGQEAAELADERARTEIKAEDEKRAALYLKRDEKKMELDAIHEAKLEVRQMKADKEHSKAMAKARAAEREKKKRNRMSMSEETMKQVEEDLGSGKRLNYSHLARMSSLTLGILVETHGDKLTPEEIAEAEEEAERQRKEEVKEALRQDALERAQDALYKEQLKEEAEEEKRRLKEEEAEAKYEIKRAAEVRKAEEDELKAEQRIEAAEKKRSEDNEKRIARLEAMLEHNEAARNEVREKKKAEDDARVASTVKALEGIREALKEGVPLSAGALDLLTTAQLQELRDTEGGLGAEDDAMCAEAMVKASRFEKNEVAEAERREARFAREKAHEMEMLELGRKRVVEGERRWREEGERDAKARAEKKALREKRAAEKKMREDEKAAKLARIASRQEAQQKIHDRIIKESVEGDKTPVDLAGLADLSAMLLGDALEALILKDCLSVEERDRVDEMMVAIVEAERIEREDMEDFDRDEAKRLKRVRAREAAEWRAAAKSVMREEMLEARLAAAEKKEEELAEKKMKAIEVAAKAKEECERVETQEMAARVEAEETKRLFVAEQMKRVEPEKAKRKEAHEAALVAAKEKREAMWVENKDYVYQCLEEGETNLPSKYIREMGAANIRDLLATGKLDEKSEDKAKDALLDATADEEDEVFALNRKYLNAESAAAIKEDKLYRDMCKKAEAPANKLLASAKKTDKAWKKAEYAVSRSTAAHDAAVKRVEDAVNAKVRNVGEAEELKRLHNEYNAHVKEQEELEYEETLRKREAERNQEAELRALKALKEKEQKFRRRKDKENMLKIDAALARSEGLDVSLLPPMGSANLSELLQCGILSVQEQETVQEMLVEATAREHEEKAFYIKMEKDAEEALVRKRKEQAEAREEEEKRLRRDEKHHQKLEEKLIKAQRMEDEAMELKSRLTEEATELRIQANEAAEEAAAARLEAAEKRLEVKDEIRRKKPVEKEKRRQEYEGSHQEERKLASKREAASMRKVEKDLKHGRNLNPAMVPLLGPRNLNNLLARGVLRGDDVKLAERAAAEQTAKEEHEREERERRRLIAEVQVTTSLQQEERGVRQAAADAEWKAEERAKSLEAKATKKEAEARKAEVAHAARVKAQLRAAAANETKRKAESKREDIKAQQREFEIGLLLKKRKGKEAKDTIDHDLALGKPLDRSKLPLMGSMSLNQVLFTGAEEGKLTAEDRTELEKELARAKEEEADDLKKQRQFEDDIREADAEAKRVIAAEEATQKKLASAERREAEATVKLEAKKADVEVLERKADALRKHTTALRSEAEERVREEEEAADEERDEKVKMEEERQAEDGEQKKAAEDVAKEKIDRDLKNGDPVADTLLRLCTGAMLKDYLSSGKVKNQRDIDEFNRALEDVEEEETKTRESARFRRDVASNEAEARKKSAREKADMATKKSEAEATKAEEVAKKAKEGVAKLEEEKAKREKLLATAEGRLKAAEEGRDKLEADAKAMNPIDYDLVNMVEEENVPLGPLTLKRLEANKGGKNAKRRLGKELDKKEHELVGLQGKLKEQKKHLEAAQKHFNAAEDAVKAKQAEIQKVKDDIEGKPSNGVAGAAGNAAGAAAGAVGSGVGNAMDMAKK